MEEVRSLTTTQEMILPCAHPLDNLVCFANTYPLDSDLGIKFMQESSSLWYQVHL